MQIATTPTIAERDTLETLGVVSGEAIIGAHLFRDLLAGMTDIIGGRATGYEKALREARDHALTAMVAEAQQLGANAVVGVDIDYGGMGSHNGMMMVTASGTAVRVR